MGPNNESIDDYLASTLAYGENFLPGDLHRQEVEKVRKVLEFLSRVERREIGIKPLFEMSDYLSGDLEYQCDNGYRLWVFADKGGWDYVEAIFDEQGNQIFGWDEPWDTDEWQAVRIYSPDNSRDAYGF